MKIHYLPSNIDGQGCYRCIFPAAYLTDRGHDAGIPGFILLDGNHQQVPPLPGVGLATVPPGDFLISYLQDTVPLDADVYVIQSGTHQWQKDTLTRLKAENPSARFVLELDDHLHDIPAYNPAKLAPTANRQTNRRIAAHINQGVDALVVSTPELARFYGQFNPDVTVIPNYLHWPMWQHLPPVYVREDWARFRVGYMGSAQFHSQDLKQWAPQLQAWLQRHPDVEFVAAGDPALHRIVGTPRGQRVTTGKVWFRNLDLAYITSTFDVGLVPLVKNAFNEAKSCLKGMEYGASGIPAICTPTEEYRRYVQDGETGFHVKTGTEAVQMLDLLYNDRDLLKAMGEAAYERAREHSLDRHIREHEGFYESVIGTRPGHRAGEDRDAARGGRLDTAADPRKRAAEAAHQMARSSAALQDIGQDLGLETEGAALEAPDHEPVGVAPQTRQTDL